MKKIIITLIIVLLIIFLGYYFLKPVSNYNPDLTIKCIELSNIKEIHRDNKAETVIWSSETNSCLAFFRSTYTVDDSLVFSMKIEDLSNSYTILWYNADFGTNSCIENGTKTEFTTFVNKYNNSGTVEGCRNSLKFDPLIKFEKTARELSFKQF